MRNGSPLRLRLCITGLVLSLCANGCATLFSAAKKVVRHTPPVATVLTTAETTALIVAQIARFYRWLRETRQLLRPVTPLNGWPKPRQVDPETLEPITEPKPLPLEERVEEFLKSNRWDQFAMGEMT